MKSVPLSLKTTRSNHTSPIMAESRNFLYKTLLFSITNNTIVQNLKSKPRKSHSFIPLISFQHFLTTFVLLQFYFVKVFFNILSYVLSRKKTTTLWLPLFTLPHEIYFFIFRTRKLRKTRPEWVYSMRGIHTLACAQATIIGLKVLCSQSEYAEVINMESCLHFELRITSAIARNILGHA